MGCTTCDDNKIPLELAKGADGRSVYIAFASDNIGSNFSYTPSDSLEYISFVSKIGSSVTQAEFTTWVKYHGEDGTNGVDGLSVVSATINDEGDLILTMSDTSTINAGSVDCCQPLQWTRLTLAYGWAEASGFAAIGFDPTAYYAIDQKGFLHLRGIIDADKATNAKFVDGTNFGNTAVIISSISETPNFTTDTTELKTTRMDVGFSYLSVNGYNIVGTQYWMLDSVPPIYIR